MSPSRKRSLILLRGTRMTINAKNPIAKIGYQANNGMPKIGATLLNSGSPFYIRRHREWFSL